MVNSVLILLLLFFYLFKKAILKREVIFKRYINDPNEKNNKNVMTKEYQKGNQKFLAMHIEEKKNELQKVVKFIIQTPNNNKAPIGYK